MSVTKRSKAGSLSASLAETILFFGVLSPILLVGVPVLCAALVEGLSIAAEKMHGWAYVFLPGVPAWMVVLGLTKMAGSIPFASPGSLVGWVLAQPIWALLVTGALYLLLVLFYWAPASRRGDLAQLRAFFILAAIAAVAAGWAVQQRMGVFSNLGAVLQSTYGPSPGSRPVPAAETEPAPKVKTGKKRPKPPAEAAPGENAPAPQPEEPPA